MTKSNTRLLFFALLAGFYLILTYVISGCKDTITDKQVNEMVLPDSNLSYASHIAIIIETKCGGTDCHSSSGENRPNLISYGSLTAGYIYVVPYSPDTSPLVWAIEHKSGVVIMPPPYSGRGLTANHIKGIRTWIKEGAKNN